MAQQTDDLSLSDGERDLVYGGYLSISSRETICSDHKNSCSVFDDFRLDRLHGTTVGANMGSDISCNHLDSACCRNPGCLMAADRNYIMPAEKKVKQGNITFLKGSP
jgi:hypothetical protein